MPDSVFQSISGRLKSPSRVKCTAEVSLLEKKSNTVDLENFVVKNVT